MLARFVTSSLHNFAVGAECQAETVMHQCEVEVNLHRRGWMIHVPCVTNSSASRVGQHASDSAVYILDV